ncbi:tyrosine-type recombinase/integrase [Psychrobacter celer]
MLKLTRVKFASSGERYSLLTGSDGLPLWYPTLFATSQLRNAAKAPNTIEAHLNAIKLLFEWANSHKIDLKQSFLTMKFLTVEQIESLCSYLKQARSQRMKSNVIPIRMANKERTRASLTQTKTVAKQTYYIRISYITDYLEWFAKRVLSERKIIISREISHLISLMTRSLKARRPTRSINQRNAPRGVSEAQRELLLSVCDPKYPNSPFSSKTRERDSLIVEILYRTGVRLGELLSIKISDLNFQENTLLIARRHDDVEDPRIKQPVAKTLDRLLPLSRDLSQRIHDYILRHRSLVKGANRHEFLFVTYKSGPDCGMPLSTSSVYRIINRVTSNIDCLSELTPHVLRHTWNDRFSEKADKQGLDEAEEEKLRSYLMGWKEGSGTSATYTRRHIEKEAHKVSLQLQGVKENEKN